MARLGLGDELLHRAATEIRIEPDVVVWIEPFAAADAILDLDVH